MSVRMYVRALLLFNLEYSLMYPASITTNIFIIGFLIAKFIFHFTKMTVSSPLKRESEIFGLYSRSKACVLVQVPVGIVTH